MDKAIPINERVFYVGVNDRETDLFESIWPLPRGVSYNSYVLVDEKVAIVDTVKRPAYEAYLGKIRQALGGRTQVDYLIVNHLEPDHSGSIRLLREAFPGIEIVASKKAADFLAHLYGITEGIRTVEDGQELPLGRHKLRFHITPMVHWPETMMTYDTTAQILFSGDAFGGFGALDGSIFDDEVDIDYFDDEILRYFSNIVGKYCVPVQNALKKLAGVPVKIIAPTHGPVWRANPRHIIDRYDRWSRHEGEEGVVILYGSMYGHSTRMMEAVARGLTQEGLSKVRVHDVSRSHPSFVVRDAWRYRGLIIGSPTYDTRLFPPMAFVLQLLQEKLLRNRIAGIFGTYGWSGGGVKAIRDFVEKAGYELVEPVVEARFSPTAEDTEQCHLLGSRMAQRVRQAE